MSTYSPKASEIDREWLIIDADGLVLGRLATEVASLLRGKHKPTFAPHIDTGDHVIIINADKVVLTSGKAEKKMVYRHSGYPGGLKERTFADLLAKKPEDAVRSTVRGMLPVGETAVDGERVERGSVLPSGHGFQQRRAQERGLARAGRSQDDQS